MMFSKRPTRNESEDDILKQQEEFLRQNNKLPQSSGVQDNSDSPNKINANEQAPIFKDNHDIVNLKCNIFERDIVIHHEYAALYTNQNNFFPITSGFPIAERLISNKSVSEKQETSRGVSLYAKKYLNRKVKNNDEKFNNETSSDLVTGCGLGGKNWKKDINEIKNENIKLIENMSKEEIENARAELLKKLNPKVVAFLQSKKFKYRSDVEKQEQSVQSQLNESKVFNDDNITSIENKIPIPIEDIKSNKYVHMNVVEKEKLDWIGDIPQKNLINKSKTNFSARFNFEGDLISLDKSEEIDVHQGLHHHGDEPERPGYTINELFMYLQSAYSSQKVIGLKVFEKIITKAYLGMYDACFNENLVEYLLKDTSLVLVVRTCLDENADTVWKSSISTLKSILCNTVYDELFLDKGYLLFEDYLHYGHRIDLSLKPVLDKEVEIDDQVPDQQYLMYDVVECLLQRTSILQRFAYLIENYSIHVSYVEDMLDILIRLARHSKQSAECILQCSPLMDAIYSSMVNKSNVSLNEINLVHVKTLKLFRVCITSIVQHVTSNMMLISLVNLFTKFNNIDMVNSLNYCLVLNPEDVSLDLARIILKVNIESLRLWLKLLSLHSYQYKHSFLEKVKDNFFEMFPSLLKCLNFCKTLIPIECELDMSKFSFNFQFASCIIMLFKMYHELIKPADSLAKVYCFDIYDIAMRWYSVISNDCVLPDFDTNLCILILTEFILKHMKMEEKFVQTTLVNIMCHNERFIEKLFRVAIKDSNTSSLTEEQLSGTFRDSDNLPSFGSIYFKGFNSVPLFSHDSPICLLQSLIRIALSANLGALQAQVVSSKTFENLSYYIATVTANITKHFKANIFDSIEINIVSQACMVIRNAFETNPNQINSQVLRSALRFALLVNVVDSDLVKNNLVEQVLFAPCIYTTIHPNYSVQDVELFQAVYTTYSNFDSFNWIFDPLLWQIKRNEQQPDISDEYKITLEQTISCVRFIEIVFDIFSDYLLQIQVNQTTLFELLSCAFLIDESYFFNSELEHILRRFLVKLLPQVQCSNNDTLPFFGNVADFFNKFITQFDNCSYGNKTFVNYLLVYFQQKCSTYFRNLFYSEHSHLAQFVNISFDELLMPMEMFLFPIETSLETLEIYLKTLLCDAVTPKHSLILYCQLVHHLNHTLFRQNSPIKQSLFDNDDQSEKNRGDKVKFDKLIRSVEVSKNLTIKNHLKNYSCHEPRCEFGLELINAD